MNPFQFFSGLRLFLHRILFGEFSEGYFNLATSYKAKFPGLKLNLNPCLKAEPILKFSNIAIRNPLFTTYRTTHTIQFEKIPFGATLKTIVHAKGKFNCVNFVHAGNETIQIIGYREKILHTQTRLLVYLCEGKFFMGEYMIGEKHKEVSPQLQKIIMKRYSIQPLNEEQAFYAEDSHGSLLCFCDNGFALSVKYFNGAFCSALPHLKSVFERTFSGSSGPPVELMEPFLENRL